MLRTRPPARPCSVRFASQLTAAHKPLLSRLSDRTRSNTAEKKPDEAAEHIKSSPRAISFVSHRSAQRRDDATGKWFADVPQLDFDNVGHQHSDVESLPGKKRARSALAKRHEMRPRTDLVQLFAHSPLRSTASLRLQTKRELGGDYASYLPDGCADPHRLPVDYARLFLGRNKHIPLTAQTGALNIIQKAVQRTARQGE